MTLTFLKQLLHQAILGFIICDRFLGQIVDNVNSCWCAHYGLHNSRTFHSHGGLCEWHPWSYTKHNLLGVTWSFGYRFTGLEFKNFPTPSPQTLLGYMPTSCSPLCGPWSTTSVPRTGVICSSIFGASMFPRNYSWNVLSTLLTSFSSIQFPKFYLAFLVLNDMFKIHKDECMANNEKVCGVAI